MRFHKSATTSHLLGRGPSQIAMMVASEFWRARDGAEFREEAVRCLWRARELMGVLEIANLPEAVSQKLLPFYDECRLASMSRHEHFTSKEILEFSQRLGQAFDHAAQELADA